MASIAYGGLDVHKEFIVAHLICKETGEVVRDKVEFDKKKVLEAVKRWSKLGELRLCYEASGTGFVLKRWLDEVGVACEVIAPSSVAKAPGDRVKTDKRDAKQLALQYAAGMLKVVRVPTQDEEAVRALVRLHEQTTRQIVRAKNRVIKHLRRLGHAYEAGRTWTKGHRQWITDLPLSDLERMVVDAYLEELEQATERRDKVDKKIEEIAASEAYRPKVEKLKCLKGIKVYGAMALLSELGPVERFAKAGEVMSYVGLVPSEDSSADVSKTGPITKAGNNHARWVLIEAAWHQIGSDKPGVRQQKQWQVQPPEVVEIAKKAQKRLHKKFWKLVLRKERNKAITAVARELAGFVWAILTADVAQKMEATEVR